jgi:uncharacterized protein
MRPSSFSPSFSPEAAQDTPETPFQPRADSVQVCVRVAPKASRNSVHGTCRDADGALALKVSLTAPADNGKANAALIRMLARQWRLPASRIVIAAGAHGRRKTLRIEGDPGELFGRLSQRYLGVI